MCETESKNEIVTEEKGVAETKDYFTPQKNKASKELAELFGQSENQLKKEFGIYKAKKIYKKLSYFVDAKAKLREEVIKELQNAKKRELYSVLVYPTQVSLAKLILKGTETKVRAVINFPSGEEF